MSILEEGDSLPLRLMRAWFGGLIAWNMLWFLPVYSRWFSTQGWIFTDCESGGARLPWMLVIAITGIAGLGMMYGKFARISNVIAWLGMAIIGRFIEPATGGGDLVMTYAAFLLMFARPGGGQIPLWPQKLLFLTLVTFYFSAVAHKLGDSCWRDGIAAYYALEYRSQQFWPVPILFRQPQLAAVLTYSALIIEGLIGLLPLLMRWKIPILAAGVLLHLGISWSLFIPMFGPAMVGLYLSAFRGEEIRGLLRTAERIRRR